MICLPSFSKFFLPQKSIKKAIITPDKINTENRGWLPNFLPFRPLQLPPLVAWSWPFVLSTGPASSSKTLLRMTLLLPNVRICFLFCQQKTKSNFGNFSAKKAIQLPILSIGSHWPCQPLRHPSRNQSLLSKICVLQHKAKTRPGQL